MASDGRPVQLPAASLVHGSQAPTIKPSGGKISPQSGNAAPRPAAARTATSGLREQVVVLNKNLNDSGRPLQFRVAPNSDEKVIQEVNPANGAVVAEYSASEFAALARSLGITGALVDEHA